MLLKVGSNRLINLSYITTKHRIAVAYLFVVFLQAPSRSWLHNFCHNWRSGKAGSVFLRNMQFY